jgi:twitching motility protein PilI
MAKPNHSRRVSSFDTLLDYETRSLAHVAGRPESIEAAGHWRGVGFRLGQRRLVSSFDEVMEILPMPPVTPVPGAQAWMLGVANVRGTLLPVVDLKQLWRRAHGGARGPTRPNRQQSGGNVAVLIGELFGQRTFNDSHRAEVAGENDGRYGPLVSQSTDWPTRPGCVQHVDAGTHAGIQAGHSLSVITAFSLRVGQS